MTVLIAVSSYLELAVSWAYFLCQIAAVLLGAWALVDVLLQPPQYFVAADKRSKGFWSGVNAAGLACVVLLGAGGSILGLIGVVANAVYLADVRPAVNLYKPVHVRSRIRRPGQGGSGGFGGRRGSGGR